MTSFINGFKYFCIFIIVLVNLCLIIHKRVACMREQRNQFLRNYYDERDHNATAEEFLDVQFKEALHQVDNILNYKYQIQLINERQKIFNTHLYGAVRQGTFVIVIQVHDNIIYLKALIDSLRNVVGIMKSLLIFSHDYYDYDINRIIRNITFAKYMQIFYPYSVQLHPRIYPGRDLQFCSEGFMCKEDQNKRDEILAQNKLRWWWQTHHIFENIEALRDFNSSIVFLEENNIVTEDFIYMRKVMEKLMLNKCPQCEMLNLGAYPPLLSDYHIQNGYFVVSAWHSTVRSIGMAFNRTVWNTMKRSAKEFCYHNDHHWDRSLRYVASLRADPQLWILSIMGPRVFPVEQCNTDELVCNIHYMIEKVQRYIKMVKRGLFPRNMLIKFADGDLGNVTGTGGFDDIRDRELCMYFTKSR